MKKVACPCCQNEVYEKAAACTHCGYQSETEKWRTSLRALQTITSILLFAATGLINLSGIGEQSLAQTWSVILALCWFGSAILFLVIVVSCEALLQKECFTGLIVNDHAQKLLENKCSDLILLFILASCVLMAGLICLAFSYAWWLGMFGAVCMLWGIYYVYRMFAAEPDETLESDEEKE